MLKNNNVVKIERKIITQDTKMAQRLGYILGEPQINLKIIHHTIQNPFLNYVMQYKSHNSPRKYKTIPNQLSGSFPIISKSKSDQSLNTNCDGPQALNAYIFHLVIYTNAII